MIKIAVVHYHLEPGGVTRVIENTVESFELAEDSVQFVVLSGRSYTGCVLKNVQLVEGLDYASREDSIDPSKLLDNLEVAAIEGLGSRPDIWHIHNHTLGKNPSLTLACSLLAEKSYPILFHLHDFAEDGRPSSFHQLEKVYAKAYPSSPNIFYALLNHRDLNFVQKLFPGQKNKLHLLANAVPAQSSFLKPNKKKANLPKNFFLYPVRAVRRKNLGELALISSVHKDKFFANSLGPTNPNYRDRFNRWKIFSKENNLSVYFGYGEDSTIEFSDLMASCEGIISTSIAEGFGLGFLEPWTFKKCLYGRNINEITKDFARLGVQLDHLYDRINIDINHLKNKSFLRDKIRNSLKQIYKEYKREMVPNADELAYNSIVINKCLDFGRVDELTQEEIINSVCRSASSVTEIKDQIDLELSDHLRIDQNCTSVIQNFSLKAYTHKLNEIYSLLINEKSERVEYADGEKLLNSFLKPERLNLLRT